MVRFEFWRISHDPGTYFTAIRTPLDHQGLVWDAAARSWAIPRRPSLGRLAAPGLLAPADMRHVIGLHGHPDGGKAFHGGEAAGQPSDEPEMNMATAASLMT
jgi:hypothetical protein